MSKTTWLSALLLCLASGSAWAQSAPAGGEETHEFKTGRFIASITTVQAGVSSFRLLDEQFAQKGREMPQVGPVPPAEKLAAGPLDLVSTWDSRCCVPFSVYFQNVTGGPKVVRTLKSDPAHPRVTGDFFTVFAQDPVFTFVQRSETEATLVWPDPATDQSTVYVERTYRLAGEYSLAGSFRLVNLGEDRVIADPRLAIRAWETPPKKPGFCGGMFSGPIDTMQAVAGVAGSLETIDHTDLPWDRACENATLGRCSQTTGLGQGAAEFVGINKRYFLLAAVPDERARGQAVAFAHESGLLQVTLIWDRVDVAGAKNACLPPYVRAEGILSGRPACPDARAANSKEIPFTTYIGPKDLDILKQVGSGLDSTIDFWVLGFICKPMLWLMEFFHSIIPSWGLSIILLTIVVKLLTLYWSQKSIVQMRKMQQLKPKVDALRERLKDDKMRMNQAIMDLYKREKVNPLGGCLPMLIQMPIWIALYRTIYAAVDLYQAPLFLWIDDLSAPDRYYVTPILLGGLMFVQQKMTPTAGDQMQAKMMLYLMPIMFTFFMLPLPSGLVFYILINTLLSIAHQWYINRKLGGAPAAAG